MCLATVYKKSDNSVIFKNVSRIDVEGDMLILTDIMGDTLQSVMFGGSSGADAAQLAQEQIEALN